MNLIAAVDKSWGIGKEGKLLCNLPGDLKFFKEKTMGKTVIMGRSTLESLPGGKPLPNRINVVLTRKDLDIPNVKVVHDIEELLEEINNYNPEDVMIIGGASVYNELMPYCDRLFITKIDHNFDADVKIKSADEMPQFKVVWKSEVFTENGYNYQFFEYRRKRVKL